ncbi:MAG: leucyl/phenylalanyl-tRNA--protein transferase [Rhodospirillales bacterium]|jgi:leucyl/phenylalanyl-tRNA--protein transferase|nr:leucyl/phenylalanyl-tRNA--protein transferase [Rhodospirillaceae bacterium]MDP6428128.1 leucyl/phenylalanyl-tRNA--protein transferase [Rhodospirillales bacterium]MDP6645172.1 leucyl/phenylalanyl-tRNA--protein transferase [Rhodospirillales bacterium]MDP6841273.1 leucyl/phenylalanyl-tRNA--protein transferase [Rhodospirillales bacterium]|tara:strand:- start:992 stop:1684 length:693 start_codon:yes stop_codon:yes gene_type:complete
MSSSEERSREQFKLTPDILLRAYMAGIFPMAESRDRPELFWVDPEVRGIIPLDQLHISRSLRKTVRRRAFEIHCDRDFDGVIRGCAGANGERDDTWINSEIMQLYGKLFQMGFVHTVECWKDGELAGGLYGVAIKGAFFGESMFSNVRDASKVALVHLAARLCHGGYKLLDTQFITEHLEQFGAYEVPRDEYHSMLDNALVQEARFHCSLPPEVEASVLEKFLQSSTQTS